jgi:hypothetical protein
MEGRVSCTGAGIAAWEVGVVAMAVAIGITAGAGISPGELAKTWGLPSGPRWIRIFVPSFSYSNSVRLFFLIRSMTALISLISIEFEIYPPRCTKIKKKIL